MFSPPYGSRHSWAVLALQVYRSSWVPLVAEAPGSSRHLPVAGFTRLWLLPGCHCWSASPGMQVQSWMGFPLVAEPPVLSRHLPSTRTVPSACSVHTCALVPLQE